MKSRFRDAFHTEQDTQKGKFLTFLLGEEVYAIEIRLVTEIIALQPIAELPEAPEYIKGVVNIRGKVIPVMDIRLKFKLDPVEYGLRTYIIVIDVKGLSVGLIVDNVSEVLSIPDEYIVPPPQMKNRPRNSFIKAVGLSDEQVKLILDCEELLSDDQVEAIKSRTV